MASEFDKMVEFLDSTYSLKDQLVPCLIGPVGIGKTAAVNQHAKNVKANKVVEIIASQILPNEVSGITMPDASTKAMEIYDHYRLSTLEDGDILFFDELLEADQMVLSACLTLIESRHMMSGRKLPDIQIIAATNPTIKPTMLKENIRNRFIFRSFEIDTFGTRNFILKDCGIDVIDVVKYLEDTSNKYNILSPRSLTKMARWLASADNDEDAKKIANQINSIWGAQIGTVLYKSNYKKDKEKEAREKLKVAAFDQHIVPDVDWENDSLQKIMDELMKSPRWKDLEKELKQIEMKEQDDVEEIEF